MSGASPPGTEPAGHSFAHRAATVALGIAAFLGTAALVRPLVPWPAEYGLGPKRDWFVEHKDEFDVLFVGTSRTFRGIDPRVVDEALAAAGVTGEHGPLRSFNCGVGGMLRFEADHLLDDLLAHRPARLRVVVVEGDPWDPATDFLKNEWSSRSVFWHDTERTRLALHSVALMRLEPLDAWLRSWRHVQQYAMKMLNMGQGTRIPAALFGEHDDPFSRGLTHAQVGEAAGYQPYEAFIPPGPTTWDTMLENERERVASILGRVRTQNEAPPHLAGYNLRALEAQKRRIADAGATMVVVVIPAEYGNAEERALAARGDVEHLLDYNRPDLYPQYWERGARIEEFHLSRTSAVALSKAIGADLARILRADG